MKRLYRSRTDKVLAGVCGGVGEYFDADPVLIRLFYLLATVFTGVIPGILGYMIAVVIVPDAPKTHHHKAPEEKKDDDSAV